MSTDFNGVPGQRTGLSNTPRNIFANNTPVLSQYASSFKFIDGAHTRDTGSTPTDLLRAGLILGKITTGGKYRNSIIGITTAGATNGATALTVSAAVATEVARLRTLAGGDVNLILVGPPTAAGTVAVLAAVACSAASGTTLTVASIGAALATGSLVCPADGSQIPVTVLPNASGVSVTDASGASIDQPLSLDLIGADLIATQIINLTEGDASVQTWIKGKLQANGQRFTFNNDR